MEINPRVPSASRAAGTAMPALGTHMVTVKSACTAHFAAAPVSASIPVGTSAATISEYGRFRIR